MQNDINSPHPAPPVVAPGAAASPPPAPVAVEPQQFQPHPQPQPQPLAPTPPPPQPESHPYLQPQPQIHSQPPAEAPVHQPAPDNSNKKWLAIIGVIILATIGAAVFFWNGTPGKSGSKANTASNASTKTPTLVQQAAGAPLQLDSSKNYGNKYANGILPVGDNNYSTGAPKAGYIYACGTYAQSLVSGQGGGAQARGPWFTDNNIKYDVNKKLHVQGSVMWQAEFSNKVSGTTRSIVTNDLPSHPTGTFPISANDPAYTYDRNPNTIKGQTLTYSLTSDPTYSSTPNCMGGQVGVMLTGVALFNAFDAGGRDAGAWEVQDSCDGHPQDEGEYHYHTLSSCIKSVSVHTVIGFALDGFPITGPQVGTNNVLTTSDLDACHGITSQITLDGKSVTMYHYVMTQDFPYSASCFRGTAIQPPGLQSAKPQS